MLGNLKLDKVVNMLVFVTISFPFIPSLVASSDTQPTFTLLFISLIAVIMLKPQILSRYQQWTLITLLVPAIVIGFSLVSIMANTLLFNNTVIITRFFSYLQFLIALLFGYSSTFKIGGDFFKRVLYIYLVFTIIYFITNGFIENVLIPSRHYDIEKLIASGRGARTLSPEPAFFAIQVFNIYLLDSFLNDSHRTYWQKRLIYALTSICLISSLSGYGIAIFLVLTVINFPIIALGIAVVVLSFSRLFLEFLGSFEKFRSIHLLLKVMETPSNVIGDKSFRTRFFSFLDYWDQFQSNLLLGDGFSLYQGGGFISLISSIGLIALLFFFFFLLKVLIMRADVRLKILIYFWFILNFLSGPIGVPVIGVILGVIIRQRTYISHPPSKRFLNFDH